MKTRKGFDGAFQDFVKQMVEYTSGGSGTSFQEANVIQMAAEVVSTMFADAGSQREYLTECDLRESEVDAAMRWIYEFNRLNKGEVTSVEPLWSLLGIAEPPNSTFLGL